MYNASPYAVMAKAGLLVGIMLAIFLLSSRLHYPAYAQTPEETAVTIDYPENGAGAVVAYTGVDPEGATVIWTLSGTDEDVFSIDGGALTFKSPPDYENPADIVGTSPSTAVEDDNVYEVTVQASDGSIPTMREVTVNVTNVDEDGVVALSSLQPEVDIELMAELTDPDGLAVGNTTTWQWAKSLSRTGTYTDIEGAEAAAYTPTADDVGSYLRATAAYDDAEGKYKSAAAVSTNAVRAKAYVNAPPEFQDAEGEGITAIEREVAEDADPGDDVGDPVAATDIGPDGRPEVLTYSLGGTDASSFEIDRATGQVKVAAGTTLDFETKTSYEVEVTAADPSDSPANPSRDTITVTITVTNVEEPPTITGGDATASQDENTSISTVLSTYTATDPEDTNDSPAKPLKWSLSGADGGRFNISNETATRGQLTFKAVPDYEAPASADRDNVYELSVVATDSAGETASRDVTVRVNNVEEDGTVTLSTEQPEVGTQLRAELTDLDGSISGLTWQWSGNGTGANSATYTPNEADVGSTLTVTATYTDGHGSGKSENAPSTRVVLAQVANNQAPEFQNAEGNGITSTTREVAENASVDLGDPVAATDADHTYLTYTLSGSNAALFTIDRGTGQISVPQGATLDYEANRSPRVTVRATDPGGGSDSITVNITVTNVDEPPVISGDDPGDYEENRDGPVASYRASDPERAAVTWSLSGTDADVFSITGGTLRFKTPPDYEDPADIAGTDPSTAVVDDNVYEVTVEATDHGGEMATRAVTVTVTNLDEDGGITLSSLQPQEDVALTATLADPDDGETGTAWQWAWASSSRGSYTDIKDATEAAYTPEATDVGRWLRATASYDDGEGKYKSAAGVSDNAVRAKIYENTAPVFQDAEGMEITTIEREVAEDAAAGAPVGDPVTAIDIGDTGRQEPLDYSLGDGDDNDSFDIDVATGQIKVGAGTTLDFEVDPSYTVTVTATDPENSTDTITVTIAVTNVEEPPTITVGVVTKDYAENISMSVDTYTATDDEDGNDVPVKALTWSLSGADADDFCITDAGVLSFETSPDYEAPTDTGRNNRYEVAVIATDSEGATASRDVTVRVTNMEEGGEVTLSTLQPQDGIDLTATLTDPDGGISGVTWQWYDEPLTMGACPAAAASTWGVIDGTDAKSATYMPVGDDTDNCLRATASYTDAHGSGKSKSVVSANRVQRADTGNLPPVFGDQDDDTVGVQNARTTRSVEENTAAGGDVDDEVVADPDLDGHTDDADHDPEILTYSLGGDDASSFEIDRGTGQITVGEATKLDYETKRTYTVTVTATDPSDESAVITVTIRVTAVDEAPELSRRPLAIAGRASIDYQENGTGTVAAYTASGPEGATAAWRLLGDDAGDFSISGGRLNFRASPNYERPADRDANNVYNITVRATDSGGNVATQDVTVRVSNVDDDGAVALSPSQAVFRVELTARVTDPDGRAGDVPPITSAEADLTDDAAWQWARSPNGSTGWTNIVGATSRAYTPVGGQVGSYLRVTATYTDAHGSGKEATSTPVEVLAVESDGVVALSPSQPEVGFEMTASLTDPDGGVTGVTWQWARSRDGSTGWTDIAGATSATYTPVQADAAAYLRATASYTDSEGSGQHANAVSLQVPGVQEEVAVTLSPSEPEVGVEVTASLTGPVGVITGLSWQWARSANGITGWTEIADGTSASYTPDEADLGRYLRATARYNDAQGFGQRVRAVSTGVVAVSGNGVVTLSQSRPEVGEQVTAALTDPDGGVTGLRWQWARSSDGSAGWGDIAVATSATYTPVAADVGMYLRATATYTDSQASGQTASAVATDPTKRDLVSRYDANGDGQIDRDEAIRAVQDYFNNLISRDDVIEVIRLYFAAATRVYS